MKHAILSASGSKKWLTCTRSARLEESMPDEQNAFTSEGTFMHEVFEADLRAFLDLTPETFQAAEALWTDPRVTEEIGAAIDEALDFAKDAIRQAREICKDPIIMVEQRLDFSPWVPEGFGTGDLVIVTDAWVWVLDLKGGKGVRVEAEDNSQMRLYGLGAYNELRLLYDMRSVRMTILQPRLNNFSTEELTLDELLDWGETVVKPLAAQAWADEGDFVAGEHCASGFCRARYTCSARYKANVLVARSEFELREPKHMTMDQVSAVLARADEAITWLKDVQSYALKQAIEQGNVAPGWKLVSGRATRRIEAPDALAERLIAAGVPEATLYERSLLGLTALEAAVGQKRFGELVGDLVVKPAGKPTLVPDADKRTALPGAASAVSDFS